MKPDTTLITGANSDIGASLCRHLLGSGGRVLALYHNSANRLEPLVAEFGQCLHIIKIDFSNEEAVTEFIERYRSSLDQVDAFVSLAAHRHDVAYGEITSNELIDHFIINVVPVVLLTQHLGESMASRGWGRIVIGSSIGVKFGGGDNSFCYSLTKFASELIPKAAKRWSESDVLTNVVRIGVTDTEAYRTVGDDEIKIRAGLIPMKRLAHPDEISEFIAWLLSSHNTFITHQVIGVSGGE